MGSSKQTETFWGIKESFEPLEAGEAAAEN